MPRGAYLMNLGTIDYLEAWELQRSLAAAVSQGAIPDTVLLLEHPPTITLGRRTDAGELHVPDGIDVGVVETDRGGKSTFHGPGQLVCYPILDLKRHEKDVKLYCRDLEEAVIRTLGYFGVDATRIEGLTGVWLMPPPRKIASIGVHISRWVTTHGYALNVDLDPAPFTEWITACGLEDAAFTSLASRGRLGEVDRSTTSGSPARPSARRALARHREPPVTSPEESSSQDGSRSEASTGLPHCPARTKEPPDAGVDRKLRVCVPARTTRSTARSAFRVTRRPCSGRRGVKAVDPACIGLHPPRARVVGEGSTTPAAGPSHGM